MSSLKYRIRFHSVWHAGSGLTSGSEYDSLVMKDHDRLPFLPGKTIKGLMKEAAVVLQALKTLDNHDFVETVFGTGTGDKEESVSGGAFFSSARLSETLSENILNENLTSCLFKDASTTSVENGIAKAHSLRRIQLTVPVVLYGEISSLKDGYENDMKKCMLWIKRLGMGRSRGLGRCTMETCTEGGAL